MSAIKKPRERDHAHMNAPTSDVLAYADQGSFVGLRVLGRGPVLHLTWHYPHPLPEADVNRFNEALAQSLLGRLLQRSPLPWGRHRWVACPLPAPVTWFRDPIPLEQVPIWRHRLVHLPVDPEHGPGWRLAVQMLENGGCVLSLLVSHTIGDGQAVNEAIAEAVAGRHLHPAFPAPSWRWSPIRLARDSAESVRALPSVWRALTSLTRRARKGTTTIAAATSTPQHSKGKSSDQIVEVPLVQVIIETGAYERRATDLDVASNTLLSALAARIAFRIGRMDREGRVTLALPVSDRQPGDRRGNALRPISVTTDPNLCMSQPRVLQRELKAALASLLRHGDDVSPLFPLIPYVPLWLARRLERLALGSDLPVGCSILGDLPPDLMGPCGAASLLQYSVLERFTEDSLDKLGGQLFLVCYRQGGRVLITVAGYAPNRITTRAQLLPAVRDALGDLGLDGTTC